MALIDLRCLSNCLIIGIGSYIFSLRVLFPEAGLDFPAEWFMLYNTVSHVAISTVDHLPGCTFETD